MAASSAGMTVGVRSLGERTSAEGVDAGNANARNK
jgi:hypothetical protein